MKDRSIGVVTSSTDEGVGSSCEITSCAELWETAPNSSTNKTASVNNPHTLRDVGRRLIRVAPKISSFMTLSFLSSQ
jgi:hypothetical protein